MAKPFYSMDEVCQLLGKSQDGVKQLVRDGSLREFRDAGKVFFKAEDVDKLSGKGKSKEGSGEIALEPMDDELPSLASGGTSVIGLQPSEEDDEQKRKKEGTVITASGIGVFDDDELEIDADPMAKTTITAGATDQVSLEGTGSGSGLLDLTREADDTSLGAELLDEIYPGEEEGAAAPPPAKPSKAARVAEPVAVEVETEPVYEPTVVTTTTYTVVGDPHEGLLSGLLVGTLILLALSASVVAGVLQGYVPDYALMLSNNFWAFLGGAVLVPVVALLIGWVINKAAAPRRG